MFSRSPQSPPLRRPALMILALILVALNLRLAITSAASLLTMLTDAGALNSLTVVIIPAIPTAIFALAGVSTARVASRLGVERTVAIGMALLTVGLLVRVFPDPWIVVLGTVVATGGLAVVNILLPAVVRAHFGRNIGTVTTIYTTAMSLGAATAAAAAVPVAVALGSPTLGLAAWAIPALIGLAAWLVWMPLQKPALMAVDAGHVAAAVSDGAEDDGGSAMRREPYPAGTWLLAGFFAIQALLSYVLMGWLPSIATDAGLSAERAGLLLGIAMAVGVPATAVIVPLTRGPKRMRAGFIIVGAASLTGMLGFLFAPVALPEVWAVFLGLGMCAFPLALALIAGLGRDAAESARVSTAVQSIGYTVATLGPLGAGALRQLTGGWTLVLVLLMAGALAQVTVGLLLTRVVGPRRTVVGETGTVPVQPGGASAE
ncbi:MFS transporter [Leucobacter sp. BZR 635]